MKEIIAYLWEAWECIRWCFYLVTYSLCSLLIDKSLWGNKIKIWILFIVKSDFMRNIIDSLAKLSGEEKRRYMETSSDTVMYMLSQSKEKIKESISNSIFDTLDIKEKIESLESVIVIKPWGEKELLWWVVVLDLIIYLCNKLSIDIQEIKEVKISPEMIDVIYHWEPADKNNSQVYHDLCMYFWSWMRTFVFMDEYSCQS